MSNKQQEPCTRCNKIPNENDKYCTDCGAPLQNRCSDEPGLLKKGCSFLNKQDAAYCAKCGEPTMFLLHGLITPAYKNMNKPIFGFVNQWQQGMNHEQRGKKRYE